jgi:hypothetical protein
VYWGLLSVAGAAITQYSLDGVPLNAFPVDGGMSANETYDIMLTPIG